ncbi:MAG: host attachment protein [Paracoccaceae bacterium]|nr:host attachment protein [Paracoccaceae bacterium]
MLFSKAVRFLIADEARAFLVENVGTPNAPELKVLGSRTAESAVAYASPPGREGGGVTGHGTAFTQGDPERVAQVQFARVLVGFLGAHGGTGSLVLVAPPQMLAALRAEIPAALSARVVAELDKTLTGHPLPEMARVLAAALDPV